MKINGKTLNEHRIVKVYLPVTDGAVEFRFRPLKSTENFETVMKRPEPPRMKVPGGGEFANVEARGFKNAVKDWAEKKLDWEFLKCISPTEGLEWTLVDMERPETWKKWRDDLETIFSSSEVDRIFAGFLEVQYITEDVMEKARATFLIGTQVEPDKLQPLTDEVLNTQSGEPVKE